MTRRAADEPRFRVLDTAPHEILRSLTPQQMHEHLHVLRAVTEEVLSNLTLGELLPVLLSQLESTFSVEAGAILLCTGAESALVVRASRGFAEEAVEHPAIQFGEGIVGAVAARRQAVIVEDVAAFETRGPLVRDLSSMMVAPLIVGSDLLGVVQVGTRKPRTFTDRELHLMRMIADQVALAACNVFADDHTTETAARRAEAEAALQESAGRWRTLAEVNPNGILVMDDRSLILAANPAIERIFGYSAGELTGQPMSILIPERFRDAHHAGVGRYLATGRRSISWTGTELIGLTKSGREIPVEIGFGDYVERGRHVFAGFVQDLSEWKRVEARRAAEHGVARILASNASPEEVGPAGLAAICGALGWDFGAFWTLDGVHQRLRCDSIWHRDGASVSDFADASRVATFAPGEGLPGRVWRDAQAQWIDDVLRDHNFPRVEAAAEVGLHAAFAVPIMIDGEVEGVMEFFAAESEEPDEALLATMEAIGHDVGQSLRRRRAERERDRALAAALDARGLAEEHAAHLEELQAELEMANDELRRVNDDLLGRSREAESARAMADEANRAKVEFLASMSHELRTPLNAIVGYADLIQAGIPERPAERTLKQVERIDLASRHLLSLIEGILGFARLEAGQESVHVEQFDASDLIEEVQAIMEPLASAKAVELRILPPGGPLPMNSDVRKLRQILINLVDNSVRFTEKGTIDLMGWEEDGDIYFRIRDTGLGIAEEHLTRMFEPFWQADQSTTRIAGGTGLGLALTLRLSEALGGEMTVESEVGLGTTFTVRVPTSW